MCLNEDEIRRAPWQPTDTHYIGEKTSWIICKDGSAFSIKKKWSKGMMFFCLQKNEIESDIRIPLNKVNNYVYFVGLTQGLRSNVKYIEEYTIWNMKPWTIATEKSIAALCAEISPWKIEIHLAFTEITTDFPFQFRELYRYRTSHANCIKCLALESRRLIK